MRALEDFARQPRKLLPAVALALALFADLNFASARSGLLLLGSGVVVLALLVLVLRARRPIPYMWAAAVVSIAASRALHATVIQREPGVAELLALLLMIAVAVRALALWPAVAALVPLGAAVLELGLRVYPYTGFNAETTGVLFLAIIAAAAAGLHQRSEDRRRAETTARVRRAERLELARDLHDHVAHYVTGIVVQAQAGGQVAEAKPATARELFGNIERTGQQGLEAMSRMVKLLREDDAAQQVQREPMTVVRELVAGFDAGGCRARLEVGSEVRAERWPTEVGRSVQRLVQEGLTNIRKHARNATDVRVELAQTAEELVVRVRNDGGHGRAKRFATSGFGMIGLRERVTALGGELSNGPREEGGWELAARIPHGRDA